MSLRILASCLCSIYLFTLGSSLPFSEMSDLQGPYCQIQGCCTNREDSCSVPILGTLCYCDEFCNNTRVDDCCPDFWTHCMGINIPTTPRIPTTTRASLQPATSCLFKDRALFWRQKVKDNCNECVCEEVGDHLELLCERNPCMVDPNIVEAVNLEQVQLGWSAKNYSEFWGRTLDDGVELKLGTLKPEQQFVLRMNPVKRMYDPRALPRFFDSEEKWSNYISGIQDQGWCGSSWAISTAAVASDRYGILSKGMEEVKLSAQNLISCDTKSKQSCAGGHLDTAWSFVRLFGLVDEDCFPYVARNETCHIRRLGPLAVAGCKTPSYRERTERYKVGPVYRLGNETDIMYEITKSGPVQATMKVYNDFFTYQNGIYKHSDFNSNHRTGYHSVRIVGWGETSTVYGVQKYWKVANSWGRQWGEDGYFRIAKGTNECEIESFVLASWPQVERRLLYEINQISV